MGADYLARIAARHEALFEEPKIGTLPMLSITILMILPIAVYTSSALVGSQSRAPDPT